MENGLFLTAIYKLTAPQTINAVKTPMSLALPHQDAGCITYRHQTWASLLRFPCRPSPPAGFQLLALTWVPGTGPQAGLRFPGTGRPG